MNRFDIAYMVTTFGFGIVCFVGGRASIVEPPARVVYVPEKMTCSEPNVIPPPPNAIPVDRIPFDPPLAGLNDALEPVPPPRPPMVIAPMGTAPKPITSSTRPAHPPPDVIVLEEIPDNPYARRH